MTTVETVSKEQHPPEGCPNQARQANRGVAGSDAQPCSGAGVAQADLADLIVSIESYGDLKKSLLAGELERYRASIEWMEPRPKGSLLDLGSCGDLVPVYQALLGYERICCVDAVNPTKSGKLVHSDGTVFSFESIGVNLERKPLPLPDGSFDQVVAMEVVEHLAVDPMFMVAEANRVLKTGGKLLLTTPNAISVSSLYRMLWGRHPAVGRQGFGPGTMDRHHREYTPQDVIDLVESAGFEIERFDTFDVVALPKPVRRVLKLLKILRLLRPGIDVQYRGSAIRCSCKKVGPVKERFPENLYPRYRYYDYPAYDRELTDRFHGKRYWKTDLPTGHPSDSHKPRATS